MAADLPLAPEPIMQFFSYEHLPAHLAQISQPFADLANQIVATLSCNAEHSRRPRSTKHSRPL